MAAQKVDDPFDCIILVSGIEYEGMPTSFVVVPLDLLSDALQLVDVVLLGREVDVGISCS
jgi:hypothetical protein